MKKLLITSALVVAGGAAFADGHVSIGGSGEMGIVNNGTDTAFHYGIDVTFSLTGETDNGLSFGASIDLDEADDGIAGNTSLFGNAGVATNPFGAGVNNQAVDGSVFISGDFGTLTMGDTDGAFDWGMIETAAGTAINDAHTAHAGYNGNGLEDGLNTLRYDLTLDGGFGFAVSLGNLQERGITAAPSDVTIRGATVISAGSTLVGESVVQLGLRYAADLGGTSVSFGLGYSDGFLYDAIGVSAQAGFGPITATVSYQEWEFQKGAAAGAEADHTAIGLTYSMDALTIHANWGEYSIDGGPDSDGYGVVINYDLGGGAVVAFGYGDGNNFAGTDADSYSLGIRMDF